MFSKKICKPKTYLIEYEEIKAVLTSYDVTFYFDGNQIKGTTSDTIGSFSQYFKEVEQSHTSFYINYVRHNFANCYEFCFTSEDGIKAILTRNPSMTYQLTVKEEKEVTYRVPFLKEV